MFWCGGGTQISGASGEAHVVAAVAAELGHRPAGVLLRAMLRAGDAGHGRKADGCGAAQLLLKGLRISSGIAGNCCSRARRVGAPNVQLVLPIKVDQPRLTCVGSKIDANTSKTSC